MSRRSRSWLIPCDDEPRVEVVGIVVLSAAFASAFGALFPGAPDPNAASCGSCQEFLVGSEYIAKIEARAPAGGVVYTNLATRYDELVSPHTSSLLDGRNVTNVTMQDHCALDFSDHLSIVFSRITGR